MTIAAGFVARDGILLCSDSLLVDGYTKTYEDKLFAWAKHGAVVGFAISGHATIAKMAVEMCEGSLDLIDPSEYSIESIHDYVRTTVKYVQQEYVDKAPQDEREARRFHLLAAIQLRSEKPRLLVSADGGVKTVSTYEGIGTGRSLAHYIIGPVYNKDMSVDEISIVAFQALAAAKERTDGVGGPSQFLTIRDGVLSPVVSQQDPKTFEDYVLNYRQACSSLLMDISDPSMPDPKFTSRMESFADTALFLRASWRGIVDQADYLMKYLDMRIYRSKQGDSPNPQPTKADLLPPPPSRASLGGSGES
jgi:20S proteasome alpha/beta subunit